MKTFLKSTELSVQNGGYLTSKDGNPVDNYQFREAQKHAEFIVTLAAAAKGKDFKGKKADSFENLREQILKQLSSKEVVEFVKEPKKVKQTTTESLRKEALEFVKYQEKVSDTKKINNFLQQFNIIREFETFGLFFDSSISKLNKIYTMDEIVEAVTSLVDNL